MLVPEQPTTSTQERAQASQKPDISFLVLRAAGRLNALRGATGMNAISRVMGFLMICIGVQFFINWCCRSWQG